MIVEMKGGGGGVNEFALILIPTEQKNLSQFSKH
jgi:hypothetical protein